MRRTRNREGLTAAASRSSRGMRIVIATAIAASLIGLDALPAYPLDGFERTGIRRLKGYRLVLEKSIPGRVSLPAGAMHGGHEIRLRLEGVLDGLDIDESLSADSELQEALERLVASRHPSYRVALLDITRPEALRYAALRPDEGYIPGSLGKLLVMTAIFNELSARFPFSLDDRERMMRSLSIEADRFVVPNSHSVPVIEGDYEGVTHRSLRVGDEFSLWEWIDHMISPSSNAAAAMVWKQAMLLNHYGMAYPVEAAVEREYFDTTSPTMLSKKAIEVILEPLEAAGLKTDDLKQRTFFTGTGRRVIPGQSSYATPRQLLRWLVKLEQGKLVDAWSSLEMKKLMYFTRRRYRYAASPALREAAVFFKSGSLYRCRPEVGYDCGRYRGNALNLMHSVAIVESGIDQTGRPRVYLIAMMSNVLKKNSAVEHLEIASGIEALIRRLNP